MGNNMQMMEELKSRHRRDQGYYAEETPPNHQPFEEETFVGGGDEYAQTPPRSHMQAHQHSQSLQFEEEQRQRHAQEHQHQHQHSSYQAQSHSPAHSQHQSHSLSMSRAGSNKKKKILYSNPSSSAADQQYGSH